MAVVARAIASASSTLSSARSLLRLARPLLPIAGQQDDAEVDPISEDDRSEEGGVGVEISDRQRRDSERRRHAEQGREEDVGQRDDAPVVERDDEQDGHRADQGNPLDVRLERVVLRDGADDVAGDLRLDRAEAGRVGLVDHPLHVVADLEAGQVARTGRLGPGDDGQQRPILALVVAVRKWRGAVATLDLSFELPEIGCRVVQGDEGWILLRDEQPLQIVVGPPQVAEVGVEHLVLLVERSGGVRSIVDRAQVASEERSQVRNQRVGEPLVGARVGPLDRDHQRRPGSDPIADPLERLELGILQRQELAKVGAQPQAGGRQQRQHEQDQRRAADREVMSGEEPDVPVHQGGRCSRLLGHPRAGDRRLVERQEPLLMKQPVPARGHQRPKVGRRCPGEQIVVRRAERQDSRLGPRREPRRRRATPRSAAPTCRGAPP